MKKAEEKDYYGNDKIVPRCVVKIGGAVTIPLSYELTSNSYFESDKAVITFQTSLFNALPIIKKARKDNSYAEVEIWVGYLSSQEYQHVFTQALKDGKSNDQLKKDLLKEYKDKLSLRWFGVIDTVESVYTDSEEYINVDCSELFTILQDYVFEKKYEGKDATAVAVLNDVIKTLSKSLKITLDKNIPQEKLNFLMGYSTSYVKDEGEKEEPVKEYNTNGKTYFEVITEVCRKAKLKFIQSDTNPLEYIIKDVTTSKYLWTLDRAKDFTDFRVKFGKGSSTNSSKLGIIVRSKQTSKDIFVEGTFPKDLKSDAPESSRIKIINIGKDKTKEFCEQVALDKATLFAKQSVMISFAIKNALPKLKPDHLVNIVDNSPLPELNNITEYTGKGNNKLNFVITSITENFNADAFSQSSVECELENSLNSLDNKTGEIKGINLLPDNTPKNQDPLRSTDMRLFDLSKTPLKLLIIRNQGI